MITTVSLRLLYLILDRFLTSLTLLGRATSSQDVELLVLREPTRGRAWTGPTEPCSPR
jgi:hypothetical protein